MKKFKNYYLKKYFLCQFYLLKIVYMSAFSIFLCIFRVFFLSFFFILIYTKSYGFRIERILHLYGIPNNAETYNERKQWRLGEFSI